MSDAETWEVAFTLTVTDWIGGSDRECDSTWAVLGTDCCAGCVETWEGAVAFTVTGWIGGADRECDSTWKCTVLVTVCFTRAPVLLAAKQLDFFFEAVDPGICLLVTHKGNHFRCYLSKRALDMRIEPTLCTHNHRPPVFTVSTTNTKRCLKELLSPSHGWMLRLEEGLTLLLQPGVLLQ